MPKQIVHALQVDFSLIDDSYLNEEYFDTISTKNEAKKILFEYEDILSKIKKLDFEENIWIFVDVLTNEDVIFNFDILYSYFRFRKNNSEVIEILTAIKCWVAFRLSERASKSVVDDFGKLFQAIKMTNAFNADYKEMYFEKISNRIIDESKVSDNVMSSHLASAISFLNFYELNASYEYMPLLLEVKGKLTPEDDRRIIPSSKDMMVFGKALQIWYEEKTKNNLDNVNNLHLLKYYPLVLWWNFTSVIPIRPSEFCHIKRDCLSYGEQSIRFPRFKKGRKGIHRKEITYDTLPVPNKIYEMFQNYIELTNSHGHSDFLIHFNVFLKTARDPNWKGKSYSDSDYFTIRFLGELICKFYIEIISNEYRFSVDVTGQGYTNIVRSNELRPENAIGHIERMLKPGDARTNAIISMMTQGYDKVEIARLAGHIHFETQYHYQNHLSFWIDSEIQRLTEEFMLQNYDGYIDPRALDFINDQIDLSYLKVQNEDGHLIDLELGHCKDETMPCPTFNWNYTGCYFCKHWGISLAHINENRSVILEELSELYNDLKRKINFFAGLFNVHSLDETGSINPQLKSDLKTTAAEIKRDTFSVAKLKYLLGVE